MQRLLSIALSCLFAVSLSAQEPSITYPYNPDSNTDSLIGASDLVDFLPFYGEEFTPEPLTIEGMSLEEWMEQQTSSSGGGCDFNYPDGFDGEPLTLNNINLYEVPDGKNLYITSIYNGLNNYVKINDITVQYGYMNTPDETELSTSINFPLILSESDVLTASSSSISINGYLIDSSVQAITLNNLNSSYNVPSGKNLYITSIYNPSSSGVVYINDVIIRYGTSNSGGPWLLKAGDFLSTTDNSTSVNGYLVDEDYFADCGGGGGVDISGLQEQIDAVAADSYAADAALLTASDNADDELQDQIDEAVSNLQEQLDSALASNEVNINYSANHNEVISSPIFNEDTINLTGDIEVLNVSIPNQIDSLWRVLVVNESGNTEYQHISLYDLTSGALNDNYSYVYHFGPERGAMHIDITNIDAKNLIIRFDRIDDNESIIQFLQNNIEYIPNGVGFNYRPYQIRVYSHGYYIGYISHFFQKFNLSFEGENVVFDIDYGEMNGDGIGIFTKLPSGQFISLEGTP